MSRPLTLLCLASYFKGGRFLVAAKEAGCRVLLLTREKLREEAWPHDHIDNLMTMPDLHTQPNITYAVSYMVRGEKIDGIIALDDYDVQTAADLREHLRLPGMGATQARIFRDKLAMRVKAERSGLRVPAFSGVFNYDDLRDFMGRVSPPWMLKPRAEAGAMGIKKLPDSEAFWRRLDELGDQQSYFLLEQFLPGEIFHVDSVVWDGEVIFSATHKYARPPFSVSHDGGVFITRTLPAADPDFEPLQAFNRTLLGAFGLQRGVTHTEFIKAEADGQLYFLETAARVGGAHTDVLIEAATNVNPWAEWAKLTAAYLRGEAYHLPELRQDYAATLVCLAKQQHPDLSNYRDPEIVYRVNKEYHAGVILASHSSTRIDALIANYGPRFAQDFLAYAPPLETAPM